MFIKKLPHYKSCYIIFKRADYGFGSINAFSLVLNTVTYPYIKYVKQLKNQIRQSYLTGSKKIYEMFFLILPIIRFDQEMMAVQEELRGERSNKEKIQRERDQILSQKYSFEQEVSVSICIQSG